MPRRFSFKGYYKNWFFRSLKELSFALLCEKNGAKWRGAETEEFAVFYKDIYGKIHKHYPDFFVDDHIVVEVKPTKHQRGKLVQLKAEAMKKFCESKGYTYQMVSPRKVNIEELESLIQSGEVQILEEQETNIKQYINRRKK